MIAYFNWEAYTTILAVISIVGITAIITWGAVAVIISLRRRRRADRWIAANTDPSLTEVMEGPVGKLPMSDIVGRSYESYIEAAIEKERKKQIEERKKQIEDDQ